MVNPFGTLAHRFSYVLKYGSINVKDVVRHKCKNNSCVNPEHLFITDRKPPKAYDRNLLKERFYENKTINENGCWILNGSRNTDGYCIKHSMVFPKEYLAHRISYLLNSKFTLPPNLCVLHKCDNPPCVNPEHLFIGTRNINNKDRAAKGRTVTPNMNLTHCKRGHEFTPENTITRITGTRLCRTCNNEGARRRQKEYRR